MTVTCLRNNRRVSWPGFEPATESRESDVLTTTPPSHPCMYGQVSWGLYSVDRWCRYGDCVMWTVDCIVLVDVGVMGIVFCWQVVPVWGLCHGTISSHLWTSITSVWDSLCHTEALPFIMLLRCRRRGTSLRRRSRDWRPFYTSLQLLSAWSAFKSWSHLLSLSESCTVSFQAL